MQILGSEVVASYLHGAMSVQCVRCAKAATSVLTYNHRAAEAYLADARGDEASFEGLVLCEPHATRFIAPVGWRLIDHRTGDLTLFGDVA